MPFPLEQMHKAIEAAGDAVAELTPDGLGWMVAMFDVDELGHLTYMGTLERDDMIAALRELIAALEKAKDAERSNH